jgi:hypothetical protein
VEAKVLGPASSTRSWIVSRGEVDPYTAADEI